MRDYMEHIDEGVESIHVASSRRQLFAKTHSHKSPQPGNIRTTDCDLTDRVVDYFINGPLN